MCALHPGNINIDHINLQCYLFMLDSSTNVSEDSVEETDALTSSPFKTELAVYSSILRRLKQIPRNHLAENNTNVLSHSSEGQKSEFKVSAGPSSLQRL